MYQVLCYNIYMSLRKVSFVPDEYYHIYNRGNSKQKIFHNQHDYEHFMKLLYLANSNQTFIFREIKDIYEIERKSQLVSIGAYCLMPNHFHLLLIEKEEGGITKFMHKLSTSYSMYYNKKYTRTGGLFEGKFQSEYLDSDQYLKYIFSYIHLNPIKLIDPTWKEEGIKDFRKTLKFLEGYSLSSYNDYLGVNRKENVIINKEDFPNYFPTIKSFENEILEWINFKID